MKTEKIVRHQGGVLTERQQEVLDTYLTCMCKQETANKLGLSRSSVRSHLQVIERKGQAPWLSGAPQPEHLKMVKTTVQYDAGGNVVQEWRRNIPDVQFMEDVIEACAARLKGLGKAKARRGRNRKDKGRLVEIDIYDPHIGMYADARETNDEDYDTDKASIRMVQAVENLLERTPQAEERVLVFGGDIQHSDNRSNTTEMSKNVLDVDTRYFRVVNHVARTCVDCVHMAAASCKKLTVVVIPGNHDYHAGIWLQTLLRTIYEGQSNVTILDQYSSRKVMVWGENMLCWAHGDGVRGNKWAPVIAAEFAKEWGNTTFRHLKLGHIHHAKTVAPVVVDEQAGLLVEHLEALCPSDAWHSHSGFVGTQRGASAFEYDKKYGLYTRHYHSATRV